MTTLAFAVLIASFLGSLHCVGMCGPFAVWAAHGGSVRRSIVAYHLGRLTTYVSAGLVAGVLGSMVQVGGQIAGYQSMAAKVAGGLLVILGIARLMTLLPWFRWNRSAIKPSSVASLLQRMKPILGARGPLARAYLVGLLTTWLPCGWLYLFVLLAAGTGQIVSAMAVMGAFWVGSLPALTALALGARQLIPRMQNALPIVAGVLLIVTGLYTATGRAATDLSTMVVPKVKMDGSVESLFHLHDTSLPCCDP